MMRKIAGICLPVCLAGSVLAAQTAAPDYYSRALFAVTTAEQLAAFCPSVQVNLQAANEASEALLGRLSDDGIEGEALTTLQGVETAVAALQQGFVDKHGLETPSEQKLCAAAAAEISEMTDVGSFLREVTQ